MRWMTIAFSGDFAASAASRGSVESTYGCIKVVSRLSGTRAISAKSIPANFTDSDSRRRRLPWHSGHSPLTMYCAARFFISGLVVVANVCSTCLRALVNVP